MQEICWNTEVFPQRNFLVLCDKYFSTENLDTPPPPLIQKLFCYRTFSETHIRRVPLRNFSALRQKIFDRIVISPLLSINFIRYRKISGKQKGSFTKVFGPVRRKISTKPWCPPSYAWEFSIPEFFRNTEGFPYEIYRHCETKIFQRSLVISPSYA